MRFFPALGRADAEAAGGFENGSAFQTIGRAGFLGWSRPAAAFALKCDVPRALAFWPASGRLLRPRWCERLSAVFTSGHFLWREGKIV
jgi:hypothetical protein